MEKEIKLNLNVQLPGSVMFSEQLCSENSNLYDTISIIVSNKNKKKVISAKTRKCIPATQSLNITKEAYNYFTGKESPYSINNRKWLQMSKKERLKTHLDSICESLGGISYTYEIFND